MLYKRSDQQAENQYGNCLIVQGLLLKEEKNNNCTMEECVLVTLPLVGPEDGPWAFGRSALIMYETRVLQKPSSSLSKLGSK